MDPITKKYLKDIVGEWPFSSNPQLLKGSEKEVSRRVVNIFASAQTLNQLVHYVKDFNHIANDSRQTTDRTGKAYTIRQRMYEMLKKYDAELYRLATNVTQSYAAHNFKIVMEPEFNRWRYKHDIDKELKKGAVEHGWDITTL